MTRTTKLRPALGLWVAALTVGLIRFASARPFLLTDGAAVGTPDDPPEPGTQVRYKTAKVSGLDIFSTVRPGRRARRRSSCYGSDPSLYPQWQEYLRRDSPPTLIVWGKNDKIFPAAGAHPYKRDVTNPEFHLLDTGDFALEEDGPIIARLMRTFPAKQLEQSK